MSLPKPLSYSAPAMARRVKKNPSPGDLALKRIADQEAAALASFALLRTLVVTPEFNGISNLIASHFSVSDASEPTLGTAEIGFYLYRSNLNRWTDPRLTDFVAAIEALEPDASKMTENKDYFSRDYNWSWGFDRGLKLQVHLSAYENKDTSECRRVQIGTKTVEQPVYRYDCVVPEGTAGDLPPPAPVLDHSAI